MIFGESVGKIPDVPSTHIQDGVARVRRIDLQLTDESIEQCMGSTIL
jgi:hypothetical protein